MQIEIVEGLECVLTQCCSQWGKAPNPWLQVTPYVLLFCLPQLKRASLAARVDVCILSDCPTVRWAGRPIFTDVQLLSAIALLTEAVLQSCTHLHNMLHTGEHHNIMQIFQRWYMGQKHLAYNQTEAWALQTFHTKLASSSSSGP